MFICLMGGPLIYDGAAYCSASLILGRPHYMHGRIAHALFEWPMLAVHGAWPGSMENRWLQGLVFGGPYMASAAAFLTALARYGGTQRARLVWLTLMFGALLPNLLALSFELNHVCLLSGTLFLMAGERPSTRRAVVMAAVSAVLFFIHPSSCIGFGLGALVALAGGPPSMRERLVTAVPLGILAVVRACLPLDSYERSEATGAILAQHFRSAVWGAPLLMGCVAAVFAWRVVAARRWSRMLLWLPLIYAAVGLYWTGDDAHWKSSLDYRRFPIVVLPALAVLAAKRRRLPQDDGDARFGEGLWAVSCGFGLVLAAQGFAWNQLRTVLQDELRAFPGIHRQTEAPFQWMSDTALGNWTLPHQCLMLEPGSVTSLVFVEGDPGPANRFVLSHHLTLDIAATPRQGPWNFAAFQEANRPPAATPGSGFHPEENYAGRRYRWAHRSAVITVDASRPHSGPLRLRLFSAFGPQRLTINVEGAVGAQPRSVDLGASHFGAPVEVYVDLPAAAGVYRIDLTADSEGGSFPNDPRTMSWGVEVPIEVGGNP